MKFFRFHLPRFRSRVLLCLLWVSLCFGLTSAVYLSWLDRLVRLTGSPLSDWVSMGAGYLMQAAGMFPVCFRLRRNPGGDLTLSFQLCVLLFTAVMVPTLLASSVPVVIAFGLLMNLLCGLIAGFYLHAISLCGAPYAFSGPEAVQSAGPETEHRSSSGSFSCEGPGFLFGGGYAAATLAVALLALPDGGSLLHGRHVLLLYLLFAAVLLWMTPRLGFLRPSEGAGPADSGTDVPDSALGLACLAAFLLSTVKNLGFAFPSADIEAGLIPELSRLPYALGLLAAGILYERNRKAGMLCTVAALILPFLMLGLTAEPLPSAIFWGLDYLFFGFFSVFRVVLFIDLAREIRRPELAPLGLLIGRLGDAAGTAVSLVAPGRLILILITALLFFPTVFLFFRLYQKQYEPEVSRERSEQEVFETFCLHNDLSARERDVFRMLLSGNTNGEIAEALFISENTVKYHVRNILQKTGCRNRTDLQHKYMSALYPGLLAEKSAARQESGNITTIA